MTEQKTELQRNAQSEARRKELEIFQRALDIQWLDSRMGDGKVARCLALIKRESEMEKNFQERTDHAAIVNARAAKEIALGKEVAALRHDEEVALLRRHYLRQRDPELRQLMQRLQAAYVCRDQRQQILHNEYKRLQDKVEEQRANKILSEAYSSADDQALRERKAKYCKELQEQMVSRQRQRQCQYEDSLIEKKMLEETIKTMYDEDMKELQQKRSQREQLRYEMQCSQQARAEWARHQREVLLQEERALLNQPGPDRDAIMVEERERKNRIREENNQKITDKLQAEQASRAARSDVILRLQEQEYLELGSCELAAAREKLERGKRETMAALTQQMEGRREEARRPRATEADFRQASEAKKRMEEEKERQKEQKVKDKRRAYATELLRQVEDNAARRGREREREGARVQDVWDCRDHWRAECKTEGDMLVREHAPHVWGPAPTAAATATAAATTPASHKHPKCNSQCQILRSY